MWVEHQVNGFVHIDENIDSLWNKDNSLVTNAYGVCSMDASIPNMWDPSFSPSKVDPLTEQLPKLA